MLKDRLAPGVSEPAASATRPLSLPFPELSWSPVLVLELLGVRLRTTAIGDGWDEEGTLDCCLEAWLTILMDVLQLLRLLLPEAEWLLPLSRPLRRPLAAVRLSGGELIATSLCGRRAAAFTVCGKDSAGELESRGAAEAGGVEHRGSLSSPWLLALSSLAESASEVGD